MSDEIKPSEDLQDLYENAPCGYLSMDADGRIVKVNTTLCEWIGRPQDQIVGKRLRDLLNVAGGIFYETHFAPLLRMQGYFHEVALDFLRADGSLMPMLGNAAERKDASGRVLFTRLAIFNATQRRRYERELANAREQERTTAELREQFIAVLGHDLRNPLAGFTGGLRMLAKEHDDPKTAKILRLMAESAARMGGLIDNLMDFARGRLGGGIAIERSVGQQIEPTLSQVIDEISAGYPDREIQVRFDLAQAIDVDHGRIAQMFSNLLGNAITHGAHDKPILVEAAIAGGQFELAVANGGEPIPPAAMERLFQPFYRGDVQPSTHGLGLGLYIASQIAEAHGGALEVRSDESETRFIFRLPIQTLD